MLHLECVNFIRSKRHFICLILSIVTAFPTNLIGQVEMQKPKQPVLLTPVQLALVSVAKTFKNIKSEQDLVRHFGQGLSKSNREKLIREWQATKGRLKLYVELNSMKFILNNRLLFTITPDKKKRGLFIVNGRRVFVDSREPFEHTLRMLDYKFRSRPNAWLYLFLPKAHAVAVPWILRALGVLVMRTLGRPSNTSTPPPRFRSEGPRDRVAEIPLNFSRQVRTPYPYGRTIASGLGTVVKYAITDIRGLLIGISGTVVYYCLATRDIPLTHCKACAVEGDRVACEDKAEPIDVSPPPGIEDSLKLIASNESCLGSTVDPEKFVRRTYIAEGPKLDFTFIGPRTRQFLTTLSTENVAENKYEPKTIVREHFEAGQSVAHKGFTVFYRESEVSCAEFYRLKASERSTTPEKVEYEKVMACINPQDEPDGQILTGEDRDRFTDIVGQANQVLTTFVPECSEEIPEKEIKAEANTGLESAG